MCVYCTKANTIQGEYNSKVNTNSLAVCSGTNTIRGWIILEGDIHSRKYSSYCTSSRLFTVSRSVQSTSECLLNWTAPLARGTHLLVRHIGWPRRSLLVIKTPQQLTIIGWVNLYIYRIAQRNIFVELNFRGMAYKNFSLNKFCGGLFSVMTLT